MSVFFKNDYNNSGLAMIIDLSPARLASVFSKFNQYYLNRM